MFRLNLSREPQWLELAPGVRIRLAPCTSALMAAARNDAAVTKLAEEGGTEAEIAVAFAKALGEYTANLHAPAIINAIHDATGVWVRHVPATPEKLLKLLKEPDHHAADHHRRQPA